MASFNTEQTKELRDVFDMFDKDKNGSISNDELAQIFAMLGVKITKEQVSAVIKKVDQNADGQLSFEEFLTIMSHQPKSTQSDAYLIAAFKSYDKDGDGYITRAELRESLAKTGETLSEAELQSMIEAADLDNDGRVNMQEFLKMMKS